MKNITFFICSLNSGGAEHQLSTLANLLVKRNCQVKIVTFSDKPDHYYLDPSIVRKVIYHKNYIFRSILVFFYLLGLKTDCFISFGQRENLMSLIPFAFKKTKFIAGERNYTVGNPTNIEIILTKLLYKRANYIVPNSNSQANHLIKSNKYLSSKIRVIHNYTDLEVFNFNNAPNNNIIQIGVFCRMEPQKNILRFVEAISKLKESCDIPFQIQWFGNHSFVNRYLEDYYNKFVEQIMVNELSDIIILHNPVKNVKDYLIKYDAIALPSLYEGFSNSISEAICCGKPMLVSRISDNSLMVHEGVNGFLFEPTDTDEIVNAFSKFLHLPEAKKIEFGLNSRKIAESLFNEDKFVSDYLYLIDR